MSPLHIRFFLIALLSVGGFFLSNSRALDLSNSNYSITFAQTGWDTVQNASIVAKNLGTAGIGIITCTKGTIEPNLDSLAVFYADSLGGRITKGKDSSLTLGKYQVKWQEFKYDSLPKLSSALSIQAGFPIQLKDGSFRVYYLISDGFIFTLTGLPISKIFPPPYADIQAAIKTLKLLAQAGIREIVGAWGGPEMWIHGGRLGGAWFAAHRPLSIDCFNIRGSWIGAAKPTGTAGIWTLPAIDRNAFLRIVASDGSFFHLPIRE